MIRNAFFALGMALALLLATAAPQTADAKKRISDDYALQRNKLVGSGKLITKQIDKPAFDEISASRSVKVILTAAPSDVIDIKADDNVMPYVVITCKERELKVTIDNVINSLSDITVEVTVPVGRSLSELSASSAAKIVSSDALTVGELDMDASSAGKIELADVKASEVDMDASSAAKIIARISAREVDMDASSAAKIEVDATADNADASASSAATIELSGTVQITSFEASSAGRINASKLNARTNRSRASSGAKIEARATDTFHLDASSGGSIETFGEGRATGKTSSGGSFKHNR